MTVPQGAAAELARHWTTCSERFLLAAGHLPAASDEMILPRAHLLAAAVEYRLKSYLCTLRGGAPETRDLSRLATLAVHCGLSLSRDQEEIVLVLEGAGGPAEAPGAASPDRVRALCDAIAAQATQPR